MRVVVTGGAGYIGSIAVARLVARGDDVVVIDNLSQGHAQALPNGVPLSRIDICDRSARHIRAARAPPRCGAALRGPDDRAGVGSRSRALLAGQHRWHAQRPRRDARRRGAGHRLLVDRRGLRHARADPDRRGRAACSRSIPTAPRSSPPSAPSRPTRRPTVSPTPRCATSTSPAPSGDVGEDHRPETHLIPSALDAAAGRREPLSVFGTDFPTADGTAIRDYVHVEDLIDAHLLALDRIVAGDNSLGADQPRHARRRVGARGSRRGRARDRDAGPCRIYAGRRPATPPSSSPTHRARARFSAGNRSRSTLDEMVGSAWDWRNDPAGTMSATSCGCTRRTASIRSRLSGSTALMAPASERLSQSREIVSPIRRSLPVQQPADVPLVANRDDR